MPKNKQKTNQYSNETELLSHIIRINNKTFVDYLEQDYIELDKLLQSEQSEEIKEKIIKLTNHIIIDKRKKVLLVSKDDRKYIKSVLSLYKENKTEKEYKEIYKFMRELTDLMIEKSNILKYKKSNDVSRLLKYIKKHTKSKNPKLKRILRQSIISLSERNIIDDLSFEKFGEMILLLITNILKKPKFSGYSYRDEFISDSTDKILRYMKNFNHTLQSKITGQRVNAFSYISQYIHNSILFIIKTHKEENEEIQRFVNSYNEALNVETNISSFEKETKIKIFNIPKDEFVINFIKESLSKLIDEFDEFEFIYDNDVKISLNDYEEFLKIKQNINKLCTLRRASAI